VSSGSPSEGKQTSAITV